jgi:hypothetical protein
MGYARERNRQGRDCKAASLLQQGERLVRPPFAGLDDKERPGPRHAPQNRPMQHCTVARMRKISRNIHHSYFVIGLVPLTSAIDCD